jgi:hypothetical protein
VLQTKADDHVQVCVRVRPSSQFAHDILAINGTTNVSIDASGSRACA